MWLIKAGGQTFDLCNELAAQLVRGESVTLTRKRGTGSIAREGKRTEVIFPGHVTDLQRINTLTQLECDEHGTICPDA